MLEVEFEGAALLGIGIKLLNLCGMGGMSRLSLSMMLLCLLATKTSCRAIWNLRNDLESSS